MAEDFVYCISDGKHLKIGVTRNLDVRLDTLSTGNAVQLRLIGFFSGGYDLEREIHSRFKKVRPNGEWMVATPDLVEYLNVKIVDKFIIVSDDGEIRFYPKMQKI
jgi:hypothetical protein